MTVIVLLSHFLPFNYKVFTQACLDFLFNFLSFWPFGVKYLRLDSKLLTLIVPVSFAWSHQLHQAAAFLTGLSAHMLKGKSPNIDRLQAFDLNLSCSSNSAAIVFVLLLIKY